VKQQLLHRFVAEALRLVDHHHHTLARLKPAQKFVHRFEVGCSRTRAAPAWSISAWSKRR
jgi:hypothetical protein